MSRVLYVPVVLGLAILSVTAGATASDGSSEKLDVILLIDTSESMSGVSTEVILEFADRFRPSQRFGVITFGEDAKVVYPLSSAVADGGRKQLKKSVSGLEFVSEFKNFPGGLELALTHMTTQGRKDARRVVILLSTGELTPSNVQAEPDEILQYLRDKVLYDFYLEEIPIYAVAFGDRGHLSVMQEIGDATDGKTLLAPDVVALDDVFEVLLHGIQPPRTDRDAELAAAKPVSTKKGPAVGIVQPPVSHQQPSVLTWLSTLLAGLLVLLTLSVIVMLAINNSKVRAVLARSEPVKVETRDEPPEFTSLRKKAGEIESLLRDARERLDGFSVDLEDYGAENWEREKDLRNRYHGLTHGLFLLMDHVQVEQREEKKTVDLEWISGKTKKLIEAERIRVIPAREGDEFDGMYHKHAGDRKHKTPPGTILEVARKGYYIASKGDSEDDTILRHAEVVVSRGNKG